MERIEPRFDTEPSGGPETVPGIFDPFSPAPAAQAAPKVAPPRQKQLELPVAQMSSFEEINAAVQLANRVATEDYWRWVRHALEAEGEEQAAAKENLLRALDNIRVTQKAIRHLSHSEEAFQETVTCMVTGDEKAAVLAARTSGEHMTSAAYDIYRVADYPRRSRFGQVALEFIQRADAAVDRTQVGSMQTVKDFSNGLHAYAGRMRTFGEQLAAAPAAAKERARELGTKVQAVVAEQFGRFSSKMRRVLGGVRAVADEAYESTRASAWRAIDTAREHAEAAKQAAQVVARHTGAHASAAGGLVASGAVNSISLAGGLISRAATAVKEGAAALASDYQDRVQRNLEDSSASAPARRRAVKP